MAAKFDAASGIHHCLYEFALSANKPALVRYTQHHVGDECKDGDTPARELLYRLAQFPNQLANGCATYEQALGWITELSSVLKLPDDDEGVSAVSLVLRTQAVLSCLGSNQEWKLAKRALSRHFPHAGNAGVKAERDRHTWLVSCLELSQRKEELKLLIHLRKMPADGMRKHILGWVENILDHHLPAMTLDTLAVQAARVDEAGSAEAAGGTPRRHARLGAPMVAPHLHDYELFGESSVDPGDSFNSVVVASHRLVGSEIQFQFLFDGTPCWGTRSDIDKAKYESAVDHYIKQQLQWPPQHPSRSAPNVQIVAPAALAPPAAEGINARKQPAKHAPCSPSHAPPHAAMISSGPVPNADSECVSAVEPVRKQMARRSKPLIAGLRVEATQAAAAALGRHGVAESADAAAVIVTASTKVEDSLAHDDSRKSIVMLERMRKQADQAEQHARKQEHEASEIQARAEISRRAAEHFRQTVAAEEARIKEHKEHKVKATSRQLTSASPVWGRQKRLSTPEVDDAAAGPFTLPEGTEASCGDLDTHTPKHASAADGLDLEEGMVNETVEGAHVMAEKMYGCKRCGGRKAGWKNVLCLNPCLGGQVRVVDKGALHSRASADCKSDGSQGGGKGSDSRSRAHLTANCPQAYCEGEEHENLKPHEVSAAAVELCQASTSLASFNRDNDPVDHYLAHEAPCAMPEVSTGSSSKEVALSTPVVGAGSKRQRLVDGDGRPSANQPRWTAKDDLEGCGIEDADGEDSMEDAMDASRVCLPERQPMPRVSRRLVDGGAGVPAACTARSTRDDGGVRGGHQGARSGRGQSGDSDRLHGRVPFSLQEERALREGVSRYQHAHNMWKEILRHYDFDPKRTAVDLKDKWRNICRKGGGSSTS